MNEVGNLRPFPLFPPVPMSRDETRTWLEGQPEDIRLVTYLDENDVLMQKPVVERGSYIDPTALLIGGIIVRPGCYFGPNAVLRLDENNVPEPLIVGEESNIQDFAMVHSNTTRIGSRVIVAHHAIVHGAVIEDDVALYIQAVADGGGTKIGQGSFLDQGSYVGKGVEIPPKRYVAPGHKILNQDEADQLPPVPKAIEEIREHVLALNKLHVHRRLAYEPQGT
jgi:carbonic anhydrase/acetyltransferase-like protein (isoleucine patch superfamily)